MADAIKASPVEVKPSPEGANAKDDSKDQHPITTNIPASINANVSGHLDVKAETHKTNEHEYWYSNPDFYVATFTGFLVLVTGVLAYFTLKLWRSTRKLVKDAKKTSRHDLRAYLGAMPQDVKFIGKNHLQTYVEMLSTGKTPAKNVRQWTDIAIRDHSDNTDFPLPAPGYGKRPLVPGAKWPLGLEKVVTDEELADLMSGKKVIFVWGKAEYDDIFGTPQRVEFRYRNIGVVFSQDAQGNKQHLGWALFAEPEGNDAT